MEVTKRHGTQLLQPNLVYLIHTGTYLQYIEHGKHLYTYTNLTINFK
jgi:hypothetical protein